MARASTPTALSLDRFASILGVNPVHFNGAAGSTFFAMIGACATTWPQYIWQNPLERMVGREELAYSIRQAEEEIEEILGYAVVPRWFKQESHSVDDRILRSWVRRVPPKTQTEWGKIVAPGTRATEVIEAGVAVAYGDADGDTFDETATITFATAVTDIREIKVYFAGEGAKTEWEIRPAKSIDITGGTATVTFHRWQMIEPDLWETVPQSEPIAAIDIDDTNNLVSTVDVYRVYNDNTVPAVQFKHHCICGGVGCEVCLSTTVDGCFRVQDPRMGIVAPAPATYSEESGWTYDWCASCGSADYMELSYYAGDMSEEYRRGETGDPLSDFWATTIAWLAICRLPAPVCECSNLTTRVQELQRDLTRSGEAGFYARFRDMDIFSSAFGTKEGEVRAWQRVDRIVNDQVWEGALI